MRTYAIGDVHGRVDLLEAALQRIEEDSAGGERRIIFLGDYVDRGPDSKAVVERLMSLAVAGKVECLKGNHEAMMLQAATSADSSLLLRWLTNGGLATLASYCGLDCVDLEVVPTEHLDFLAGLPLVAYDERRIFVHAGIDPDEPIADQDERSLLWIRERFLRADELPAHVVHGHTSCWRGKPDAALAERLAHRTNLDTGAWRTGILAVGVFENWRDEPVEVWSIGEPQVGQCDSFSRIKATSPSTVCRLSENLRM